MVSESRRNLIKATMVLGLSLGLFAANSSQAADHILELKGIEGESQQAHRGDWINIQSVSGPIFRSTSSQGKIKRNMVILKKPDGRLFKVVRGRLRLPNGSIVVLRNGRIVQRLPAKRPVKRLKPRVRSKPVPSSGTPKSLAPRTRRGIEPDEIDRK